MSVLTPRVIKSGEIFPVTGYYKYAGHVMKNSEKCFSPPQDSKMLYKAGETAPPLGSCPHDIKWVFIKRYGT